MGQRQPPPAEVTGLRGSQSNNVLGFLILGSIAGAVLGFLFRPSFPLVGQLPFEMVVNRGAGLSGIDLLAKSTAEQSFNYVLIGAVLGALFLGGGRAILQNDNVPQLVGPPIPQRQVDNPEKQLTSDPFCTQCGTVLAEDVVYCGKCGKKRI